MIIRLYDCKYIGSGLDGKIINMNLGDLTDK